MKSLLKNIDLVNNKEKNHAMILRNVPPDVKKILLEQQGYYKSKCNCQVSLPRTIFRIIRIWNLAKDYRIHGVPMQTISEELFTVKKLPSE